MPKQKKSSEFIIIESEDLTYVSSKNYLSQMARKKLTEEEIEEKNEQQKMRASVSRAARRSGKTSEKEGKVNKQKAKTKEPRSQKKVATVKKSRY